MIYPNKPLYLLSLLGYIYYLTYYTLTTKDNMPYPPNYSAYSLGCLCSYLASPSATIDVGTSLLPYKV